MSTLYVWFPASWAPMVAERLFGWSSPPRGSSYPQRSQPASGLPKRTPERILGTNIVMALLVPVGQWRILTALKWCTKSGNGHCQVLQSCRCSTLAVESSGLNWMIKLSWTAILCYRRASSVMCFRRNVLLRGRVREGKGLQLLSCCQAVKMRTTGSTSCYRKRTFGLPLQPGVLTQRRFQNRSSAKSGAGCRPSICGWRSSCGGGCLLTECTPKPPLGSPKKNSMLCFLTGPPGATAHPYEEKSYRGAGIKEVQAWWKQCKDWMAHFKGQSEPFVLRLQEPFEGATRKGSRSAVGSGCLSWSIVQKGGQTREGTYQLKRRCLKPDVRDSPEDLSADVDMADI